MKQGFYRLWSLSLLFIALFGCGVGSETDTDGQEGEDALAASYLAAVSQELISDPGFESGVAGFKTNSGSVDGTVSQVTQNPIAGSASLRAVIRGYGRIVRDHSYPYGAGPNADFVTASGKLRVDSSTPNSSKKVEVCAIAYIHPSGQRLTKCQLYPVAPTSVVNVSLAIDAQGQKVSSVSFQLKLDDAGSITVTLDDASLYVQARNGNPPPTCTEDTWACQPWSPCSAAGTQNRSCQVTVDCPGVETPSPATTQSCTPPPPPDPDPPCEDQWTCGEWNACSADGTQTRTCNLTFDCPTDNDPSPATSQTCTPPAPPSDQLPTVPDGSTLFDELVDGGFETSTGSFSSGSAGTVSRITDDSRISGTGSLRATVNPWARMTAEKNYAYAYGPTADSVTVKARLRVETAGSSITICAVAYLHATSERLTSCQSFAALNPRAVVDVYRTLDVGRRQVSRVFFELHRQDSGSVVLTIDDAHLYVVGVPTATPAPDPGPGPGPGPGPNPPPSGDLEEVGFATRPSNWRSMTRQMDFRNDVSADGAAANATVKDVTVRLVPSADAVGRTRRVSFGLPLPPGVIVNTDQIRVTTSAGVEVPAFVRSLGTWKRIPDQKLLCSGLQASGNPGIRSALVQFDWTFGNSTAPVTIKVGLNQARTLQATEVPIADTYRVVNDGTYRPAVNTGGLTIREPAVLAAVDHRHLACSAIFPMTDVAGGKPYMAKTDAAQDNWFYSQINQFRQDWPVTRPEDINPYGLDDEPWLYDRAQTFYSVYLRVGNPDMLREAHRATDHYRQNIYGPESCTSTYYPYCVGSFKLKNPNPLGSFQDTKYSTSESLLSYYLLTGDATVLKTIGYISWQQQFHTSLTGIQTERHLGMALLSHAIDAELTGSAHEIAVINQGIAAMRLRQTSPLDGNAPNGCFNYPPEGQTHTFSPWMSSLLSHGFLRAYQATGHAAVPPALVDLAQCEIERGIEPLTPVLVGGRKQGPMSIGNYYPHYIGRSFGTPGDADDFNPFVGFEHCIDVAIPIALGAYFVEDPARKAQFTFFAKELMETHNESIDYWTRFTQGARDAGASGYRASPPRRYQWHYKNAGGIGWSIEGPNAWN